MSKPWLLPTITVTLLFLGVYHLRNDFYYQESTKKAIFKLEETKTLQELEHITNDEIRAEQDQILAQVALRESLHNDMTEFYVQARVFTLKEICFKLFSLNCCIWGLNFRFSHVG